MKGLTRRRKVLLLLLAIAVAGYVGYSLAYPTYTYRFRVTIEVETTDGVKTGSSVLEIVTVQYPAWTTFYTGTSHTIARGDAVFVDLGNGRNIIALNTLGDDISDTRADNFAPRSFLRADPSTPGGVFWAREMLKRTGERTVYAGDLNPTLVTLRDLQDPRSIVSVPFHSPATVLGADILRVRSWIELTKDPVTWKLKDRIPWIEDFEATEIAVQIVRGRPTGIGPVAMFRRR